MADIKPIAKGQENENQGFLSRGIDDIYNEMNQHLTTHKVFAVCQAVKEENQYVFKSNRGNDLHKYRAQFTWRFYAAEDGSFIETTTVGQGMDSGDKEANKAMSMAYKYAFMQVFCIPTGEKGENKNYKTNTVDKVGNGYDPKLYAEIMSTKSIEELGEMVKKYPKKVREHWFVKAGQKRQEELVKKNETKVVGNTEKGSESGGGTTGSGGNLELVESELGAKDETITEGKKKALKSLIKGSVNPEQFLGLSKWRFLKEDAEVLSWVEKRKKELLVTKK